MSSTTSPEFNRLARLSPLHPAGILEKAGIKVCIVGTAAVRHFGSNLLIGDLDLVIADYQFDLALSLLLGHGYCDIGLESCQSGMMPATDKPGDSLSRRLHFLPSSDIVVLSPASRWHLDITPDTTFLRRGDPYRFPHFHVYLQGDLLSTLYRHSLINIIDTLVCSGDGSLLIMYQYTIMVRLVEQEQELGALISPEDRFFVDFFLKQLVRAGKLKVLELRKCIMEGAISVEAARRIVPRPDLARKDIKEKYLRLRMERENDGSKKPAT
ncbi:unnamed protein product [Tuber aestivum]|uniref:Uncharacterized protein n=1 Tax=Tuber aestivum TaxID=59557 RepID=A0A292Q6R6_9PEZI|nr:unnamed protein product [Tuber aestivum]